MKFFFSTVTAAALMGSTLAFAPSTIQRPTNDFATTRSSTATTTTSLDMARRPFISGNWKLNPQSRDEAVKLASDIAAAITPSSPDTDVALFVPYVFIEAARDAVQGKLQVGAEVRSHL